MDNSKNQTNKEHLRNKDRSPEHQEYRDDLSHVLNDIRSKEVLSDIDTPQILIKLDLFGGENKFVHMLDEDGREYLIALSIKEYGKHANIVDLCKKVFKKDFTVIGGGYIKKDGDSLELYGKSDVFGEANMSRVKVLLEKEFPNTDIEYDGKEKHFDLSTERRNIKKLPKDKELEKEGLDLLGDNPHFYSRIIEREAKKGLGKEYLDKVLHIYSGINLNAKIERLDLNEGGVKQCLNEYGPKLGYDHIDAIVFPEGSKDICVAVRSVENGIDYGYSAVYLVWRPKTPGSDFYRDFLLFKEIANTKKTKDYLQVGNVVLDKEKDLLGLNISTQGSFGGEAISKNIEIDLQKELDPRTEETNRFPIEKKYKGFSGKERIKHIISDLEEKDYLQSLDGEKMHFLDVAEYSKEDIYDKLEAQDIGAGSYVQRLDYKNPNPKRLKVVMLKFDREKDNNLSETNFIEEMKKFGVRPIKFEEYLQFVSSHSKYIKNGEGTIYMPEKITSPERYECRISAHSHGIGMDIGRSIFQAQFPFVIEE